MSVNKSQQSIALSNSKSKHYYSFPKQDRFKSERRLSYCDSSSYPLPEVKSKRSTSFGYGNKMDFTKTNFNVPAPNNYTMTDEFNPNKYKSKIGIHIGLGREIAWSKPVFNELKLIIEYIIFYSHESTESCPDPTKYDVISQTGINPKGKYYVAKFKCSGPAIIHPDKGNQIQYLSQTMYTTPDLVGPQSYKVEDEYLNPKGRYFIQKYKNSKARSFGKSIRNFLNPNDKLVPGVGQYEIPSEFPQI